MESINWSEWSFVATYVGILLAVTWLVLRPRP